MQLRALLPAVLAAFVSLPAHAGVYSVPHPAAAIAPQGGPAPAPVEKSPAEVEFQAGSRAYAMGNYEQAVQHFERSYELSTKPELLFNLGQAYAKWHDVSPDAAHLRKARKLFQNYISFLETRPELDENAREDAREQIADIDRKLESMKDEPTTTDDRRDRRRKGAIAGGVVAGVVVVAGAIVLGVLLSRRNTGEDPELGTIGAAHRPGFHF